MATNRIVSKKELEASGLSLRDFLNKERGLTRRKETDPTKGEAKDKAAQEAADAIDPGSNMMFKDVARNQYRDSGKEMVDKQDSETAKARSMAAYVPRRAAAADMAGSSTDTFKRGGAVKASPKRATGYRGYGIAKKV